MITPHDSDYKATKRIKQGKRRLGPPYDELAQWIGAKWNVTVLNVIYDFVTIGPQRRPRLQIILEHQREEEVFAKSCNFDPAKQQAIKDHFIELIDGVPEWDYDIDGMFVVFSAFAPLAREEADRQVSEREVTALLSRLKNPDLWTISRMFLPVTFMFYTEEQVARYEAEGKKEAYARAYFEVVKPYDEFDYLSLNEYTINFDSKHNLDTRFNGSWYNYYR